MSDSGGDGPQFVPMAAYGAPPGADFPPQKKKRGWMFWTGIGCVAMVFLCGGFGGGILLIVRGALTQSTPYTKAVETASKDPRVIAALGSPLTTGFMPTGNVAKSDGANSASFRIDLSGPKGSGVLEVEAEGADWGFTVLELQSGSTVINLLDSPPAPPP